MRPGARVAGLLPGRFRCGFVAKLRSRDSSFVVEIGYRRNRESQELSNALQLERLPYSRLPLDSRTQACRRSWVKVIGERPRPLQQSQDLRTILRN
jgi:hypothetical protein